MLAECGLDLQLLLDGRIRQLRTVALHLGGRPEGALQPARRVLHVLQLAFQALELRFALPTVPEGAEKGSRRASDVVRRVQRNILDTVMLQNPDRAVCHALETRSIRIKPAWYRSDTRKDFMLQPRVQLNNEETKQR